MYVWLNDATFTSEHISSDAQQVARDIADLAHQAMLIEVYTTPKPGLVDRANNGSHKDMTVETFERSANAIHPWLKLFVQTGQKHVRHPISTLLTELRPCGIACERDMFRATAGINTHKGMLFSMALICSATGLLWQQGQPLTVDRICYTVAQATQDIVNRELAANKTPKTAGERFYHQHGLSGVRGEVESGFATIRHHALPAYLKALEAGADRNQALLETLLVLLAYNQDTNLVSRGGLAGLSFVQQQARSILTTTTMLSEERLLALELLDQQCIEKNLSPGGSADLLAITWLLHQMTR